MDALLRVAAGIVVDDCWLTTNNNEKTCEVLLQLMRMLFLTKQPLCKRCIAFD